MLTLADLTLPGGYGFRVLPVESAVERRFFNTLLVWEPPRRRDRHRYVVSVDVSDGIGQNRSVIDVTRVGTVHESEAQVAQFISGDIIPLDLAPICDAIGRFYADRDGREALMAVECNNIGITVQNELQEHLGYRHFFIWQYPDARNPAKRFSARIGWWTTPRTRPWLLTRYHNALTSIDPLTGLPEYLIFSPFTLDELRDFQIPADGRGLQDAEASPGSHDDCIMAGAIGLHVSSTLHFGTIEPLSETRRRLHEEEKAQQDDLTRLRSRRDWRNTDATSDEMACGFIGDPDAAFPTS